MPGCLIAMARCNRPSLMLYGGTIRAGCSSAAGRVLTRPNASTAAHSASAGGGKAAARRAEERGAPFSRPRAGLGKRGVEELCQSSQPGLRALVLCMAGSKVPCAWDGPATPPQALGYCLY